MLEIIERLLILQEKDQRIRTLQNELDHVPGEIAAVEKEIQQLTETLENSKISAHQNELERKKLQAEVQAKRESINRLRQQQLQTRKNEEYVALTNEITHIEDIIHKLEDRELELMEEYETLRPAVEVAERRFKEDKTCLQERIKGINVRKEQIEQRLQTNQTEREQLDKNIDEDILYQYERLFANKGGIAVAAMERGVCQGCNMHCNTQTVVDVKAAREITTCPQCGCFLYLSE